MMRFGGELRTGVRNQEVLREWLIRNDALVAVDQGLADFERIRAYGILPKQ